MKKSANLMLVIMIAFSLFLMMAPQAEAVNFLYQTPTGNTWQRMTRDYQDLRNQIPADGGPRTSAEGQRRINIMNQIVNLYDRGNSLFTTAQTVTGDPTSERRWYNYMSRSCRIHSGNWQKNIRTMQGITNSLRRQGR